MDVITVDIDTLHEDPANARLHNERNLQAIAASLKQFGQVEPLVTSKATGKVIGGNGRLQAMRSLGWTRVNINQVDIDDTQATALGLALNRTAELAEWDHSALAKLSQSLEDTDIDLTAMALDAESISEQLSDGTDNDTSRQGDDIVPNAAPAICSHGDVWEIGDHRLFCGDSTSSEHWDKLLDGKPVDCVFTSPPYGVNLDYGETYKDTQENLKGSIGILSGLWMKYVVDGGFVVLNFGDIVPGQKIEKTSEPCEFPMAVVYWPIMRKQGWLLWSRRIFAKPNPTVSGLHCIKSNRAAADWEHVWSWKKPGKPTVSRTESPYRSCLGVMTINHAENCEMKKETHGAGMPVYTAENIICIHSRAESLVMEPFAGTGTTIMAGERCGRRVYAGEINPKYCDIIIQRWKNNGGSEPRRL